MSNVIILRKTGFHRHRAPSAFIDFSAFRISLFFFVQDLTLHLGDLHLFGF